MTANLAAILQLASPTLPVGAYSYSQGLESAIDAGLVRDEGTAARWIGEALECVAARFEAPVWIRLRRALDDGDAGSAARWNDEFLASRETSELRAETRQMGYSLVQLMTSLGHAVPFAFEEVAFPTAHAWACRCWDVDEHDGLVAYLYGWLENQAMAALKSVPLGQVAGQRLLLSLRPKVERVAMRAAALTDDELSSTAPMLAILSSRHETQYSRLFRS